MKLKCFSDKKFIPQGHNHVISLYPFWGLIPDPANSPDAGRFDEFVAEGSDLFSMVDDPRQADFCIFPLEWREQGHPDRPMIEALYREFRQLVGEQARVVVTFNNDSEEELPFGETTTVLRTSFYRSKKKPNEHAIPGWSVDYLGRYFNKALPIRHEKRAKPVVGYCGYLDYDHRSLLSTINATIKNLVDKTWPHEKLRGKAVRRLMKEKTRLHAEVIVRNGSWGGSCEDPRKAYVENIAASDYPLVVRGRGNFSYRLYEVLSCGKIPLFINTDCVLPYDDRIDYKELFVWVEEHELDRMIDIVCEFHERNSAAQLIERQKYLRHIYEEWLSPIGYHRNLRLNLGL